MILDHAERYDRRPQSRHRASSPEDVLVGHSSEDRTDPITRWLLHWSYANRPTQLLIRQHYEAHMHDEFDVRVPTASGATTVRVIYASEPQITRNSARFAAVQIELEQTLST